MPIRKKGFGSRLNESDPIVTCHQVVLECDLFHECCFSVNCTDYYASPDRNTHIRHQWSNCCFMQRRELQIYSNFNSIVI